MAVEEPSFPLTATTFAAALRTGHGRALQQIERHGSPGLEDALIEACVTSLSYDPQCEADRAPWLLSMVDRANLRDAAIQAIGALVHASPPGDDRDMSHPSAMLRVLAATGSDEARRLLYLSLACYPPDAGTIADHIVTLDGLEGLKHIARHFGRQCLADPEFCVDDGLVDLLDASSSEEAAAAREALEREAGIDADIARCLAAMCKSRDAIAAAPSRPDRSGMSAAEVIAWVQSHPGDPCRWLRGWGRRALPDQREAVFRALLDADAPEHAKRFFRCFAGIGVPRLDDRLLSWMTHPDPQLRWSAAAALAQLTHVALRQRALQCLVDGDLTTGIALLVNNFEDGDFSMCARHLARPDSPDDAHDLVRRVIDLCKAHAGPAAQSALLFVHEHSPCSICRGHAVKELTSSDIAPPWLLAEAAFDAEPDTRTLAESRLRR